MKASASSPCIQPLNALVYIVSRSANAKAGENVEPPVAAEQSAKHVQGRAIPHACASAAVDDMHSSSCMFLVARAHLQAAPWLLYCSARASTPLPRSLRKGANLPAKDVQFFPRRIECTLGCSRVITRAVLCRAVSPVLARGHRDAAAAFSRCSLLCYATATVQWHAKAMLLCAIECQHCLNFGPNPFISRQASPWVQGSAQRKCPHSSLF